MFAPASIRRNELASVKPRKQDATPDGFAVAFTKPAEVIERQRSDILIYLAAIEPNRSIGTLTVIGTGLHLPCTAMAADAETRSSGAARLVRKVPLDFIASPFEARDKEFL